MTTDDNWRNLMLDDWTILGICGAFLMAGVACGPADDIELQELGDGQKRRLCRQLSNEDDCTLEFAGSSETLEAPESENCDTSWEPEVGEDCDATVGEMKQCYQECTKDDCEEYLDCGLYDN